MDNHYYVIGLYLDLTQVYEVINHNILLGKLSNYVIRGVTSAWLRSYLSNCTQYVEISQIDKNNSTLNKYVSKTRKLICGVLQGSILDPILFTSYLNDLVTCVKDMKMVLYAGDANILVLDKKEEVLQLKVETVMKQLEIWFSVNELILNIKKTRVMSFSTHHC
jgi:hypothetical protein